MGLGIAEARRQGRRVRKKPKAGTSKQAAERRRRVFVEAYISNFGNATEAAKSAGYSAKTSRQQGARLLSDVAVSKQIAGRQEALAKKLEISTERTLRERARLAYYDIGDIATAGVKRPADIAKLPEDLRQAIAGWKWDARGRFTLLMIDKNPHLTALDKHLGIYERDNEQSRPVTKVVIVPAKRAKDDDGQP